MSRERERDRSYKVMSSNGAILIRNSIHLRPIVSADCAPHEDISQYVDQHNTYHHNTSNQYYPKPTPNRVCSQHQMIHNILHHTLWSYY